MSNVLILHCSEDSRKQIMCEVEQGEASITLLSQAGSTVLEEGLVYLDRSAGHRVHDWLGEWLGVPTLHAERLRIADELERQAQECNGSARFALQGVAGQLRGASV